MTVYLPVWHIAQEPRSLFWCHAVMGLQFTHAAAMPAEAVCETYERIVELFFIA